MTPARPARHGCGSGPLRRPGHAHALLADAPVRRSASARWRSRCPPSARRTATARSAAPLIAAVVAGQRRRRPLYGAPPSAPRPSPAFVRLGRAACRSAPLLAAGGRLGRRDGRRSRSWPGSSSRRLLTAGNQLIGEVAPPGDDHRGLRLAARRRSSSASPRATRWPAARADASDWRAAIVAGAGGAVVGAVIGAGARTGRSRRAARLRPPRASARRPWPTRAGGRRAQKASAMRCSPRWRTSRTRAVAELAAAVRAAAEAVVGSSGSTIAPGVPVRALDDPGHDVLEAAEDGPALARRARRRGSRRPRRPRSPHQLHCSVMGLPRQRTARRYRAGRWPTPLTITILEGDETGPGAARAGPPRARPRRHRARRSSSSATTSRSSAGARRPTRSSTRPPRAMREAGFGIKAATITPEGTDDVGSPNRILREEVDGKVIIRTGPPHPRRHAGRRRAPPDLASCAWRSRTPTAPSSGARATRAPPTRSPTAPRRSRAATCRAVAEYAFRTAAQDGRQGLRRPEVDGLAGLRGHAQGGDGRRRRAPPRRRVPAGPDRRHLRRA